MRCSLPLLLLAGAWLLPAEAAEAIAPPPPAPAPAAGSIQLPDTADLRPDFDRFGLGRRQQGSRPTCSVFTVAGAIEFAAARQTGRGARLSVDFLNWAANEACGDRADGGFFSDLWKGYAAYGVCGEDAMPYAAALDPQRVPDAAALSDARARRDAGLKLHWIKEWDVNTGLTDAHLAAIRQTLAAGWPVCGGFRWPKQARWVEGVLQMCPPDGVYDGHSVLLVGHRLDPAQPGGGVLVFRNTAGDGRDGAMPFAYARAYMNDAAWVDSAKGAASSLGGDPDPPKAARARETPQAGSQAPQRPQ